MAGRQQDRDRQQPRGKRHTSNGSGQENWLFVGVADAGRQGAILCTLIESCRRRGIDPHAYLRDILTRLPSMTNWQINDIIPEAWASRYDTLS